MGCGASSELPAAAFATTKCVPQLSGFDDLQVGGCSIEKTEERGVSITQLELLWKHIERRCVHWVSNTGEQLSAKEINLYDVAKYVVIPATKPTETKPKGCSFVEMVAVGPQPPRWFVSHWWGTPLVDTIRMLRLHAKQRGVSPDREYYWICTFANNQHDLGELADPDLTSTPFAKAILSPDCVGTLAILNEKLATPFYRIWCIFEYYVTLTHGKNKPEPQLFDFVTIVPKGECEMSGQMFNERCAALLYEEEGGAGLALPPIPPTDLLQRRRRRANGGQRAARVGRNGARGREEVTDHPPVEGVQRPAWFPGEVAKHGFGIVLHEAQASRQEDKTNIMRLVSGKEDDVQKLIQSSFVQQYLYDVAVIQGDVTELKRLASSDLVDIVKDANESDCVVDAAEYVEDGNENIIACLEYLLEAGCDVDRVSEVTGMTALKNAFMVGNPGVVQLLLKHGADLKKADKSGSRLVDEDDIDCCWKHLPEDVRKVIFDAGFYENRLPNENPDSDNDGD
jgi:hypothetical protein